MCHSLVSGRHIALRALMLLAAIGWLLPAAATSGSPQLLMFEEQHCPYCEQWRREVGVIYDRTTTGRRLPLVVLDIHDELPARYSGLRPARYTPVFVVWHDGAEIGRIDGYPGEDFFWGLLEQIVARMDLRPAAGQ